MASPAPALAEDAAVGLGARCRVVAAPETRQGWVHGGGYREAGAVASPLPNTAGLQALTDAMDKLEALLRPKEGQSNPTDKENHGFIGKDKEIRG